MWNKPGAYSGDSVVEYLSRVVHRGVSEIIVEKEFVQLLESGRPLRLKQGFDPTRPDIHLGHAVGLRKLRQLQDLGHQVILIVGDWTAQIGDPSGQSITRPMLTPEEVKANAQTYLEQFFKIVDPARAQVAWQSEWYGSFTLTDVIKLASRFTVAQMLAREDFAKRHSSGSPIAITEFLYPLLQAYDSVMVESDVEFGGTDQKFNILLGRELQSMMGQRPQQVFLVPMLVGTDGTKKMSKSLDNYVGIDEPPNTMYGKLMSIPDPIILNYFELLTDVPEEELEVCRRKMAEQSINPLELKQRLARDIVGQFHGAQAAAEAEEYFNRVVRGRQIPSDLPKAVLSPEHWDAPRDPVDLVVASGSVPSKMEAKRLVRQGAVELDGRVLQPGVKVTLDTSRSHVMKVGKLKFVELAPPVGSIEIKTTRT
ncbi:MAG: tyrosine--tRNA ligase [Dehalococcoidia bacterium]|nr:tyrosine--tRNA ligase [Dehalococcoidia bacterium]